MLQLEKAIDGILNRKDVTSIKVAELQGIVGLLSGIQLLNGPLINLFENFDGKHHMHIFQIQVKENETNY